MPASRWISSGIPLVDVVQPTMTRDEFAAAHGLDAAQPIVTLLPGSRRNEIAQHYPTHHAKPANCLQRGDGRARRGFSSFTPPRPICRAELFAPYARPGLNSHARRRRHLRRAGRRRLRHRGQRHGHRRSRPARHSHGRHLPRSPVTAAILRHMIRTPFIAMVNLIAGRRVVPELIQDGFHARRPSKPKCAAA